MKKLLLITICSAILSAIYAFTPTYKKGDNIGFTTLKNDTKFSLEFCESAIAEGNWCGLRYENKRHIIQFETGYKVELFSANEMNITDSNCFLTDYRDHSNDIWRFTENGKIVRLMRKANPKK